METDLDISKLEKLKVYGLLSASVALGLSLLIWLIFYFPPSKEFFERHGIEPTLAAFLMLGSVFLPLLVIVQIRTWRFNREMSAYIRPTEWLPRIIEQYDESTFPIEFLVEEMDDDDISFYWTVFIFAAEAIATTENNPAGEFSEDLRLRLIRVASSIGREERENLVSIIDRIRSDSHVRDYWKNRKDFSLWTDYMDDLKLRLSRPDAQIE